MKKSTPTFSAWFRYGQAILAVAAATGLRLLMDPWLGEDAVPYITFSTAVVVVAFFWGRGPGIVATVGGALACHYFVTPPRLSFLFASNLEWLSLTLFLFSGLLVSDLAGRLHTSRMMAEAQAQLLGQREQEREAAIEFLRLVNASAGTHELIKAAVRFFRDQSGCEAVGIRLRQGEDYPYYEARGFSEEFVRAENSLCAHCESGEILRDHVGNPVLECMCGNILCGRFDPSKPFFTPGGSFWTNSTTELLASTTEADRQARTRNRCHGEGYESVALIPLRVGEQRLGLVQINDRRRNVFTLELIAYWERLAGYLAVAMAQVQAQEELRETKAILQAAMDQSPAGIAIADAPHGHLRYVNDAGLLIRGGDRAAIVNGIGIDKYVASWSILDFDGRPLKPDEVPLARAIMLGEACSREFMIRRTATDDRIVLANAAPIRDDQGKVIAGVVVFMDITERKKAEQSLRASEERLRQAQQAANMGTFDWNLQTGASQWTPELEAMYGLAPGGYPTTLEAWANLIHPEDRDQAVARVKAAFATGRFEGEWRIIQPPGRQRWFSGYGVVFKDPFGKPQRMIGVNIDITERKQAEEALRKSEADLSRAQALAHVGSWSWDTQKDVVSWSAEMYRIYGVNPATFKHTVEDITKLIYPEDVQRQLDSVQVLVRGQPFEPFEYRVIRPDGTIRVVQVFNAEIERDSAGQVTRVFVAAQDITERKRMEDALKFLAQCGSGPGQNFFEELARFLAQSIAMDYVCIDRLQEDALEAQTLAICYDGRFEPNVSYTLKDTPCGQVVGKTICCFRERVRQQFPNDAVLQEMQAESYVGTTLWGSHGKPIGLIAVIGRRPLTDASLATSILQLTAVRAAGELERQQAEEALRESEGRLRAILDATPFPIALVDAQDNRIEFWSRSALTLFGHTAPTAPEWYQLAYPDPGYQREVIGQWKPALEQAQLTGQAVNAGEYRVTCRDGSVRLCELYAAFLGDKLIVTFNDITARKLAEAALRKSQRLLAETEMVGQVGGWEINIDTQQLTWTDEVYRIHEVDLTYQPTVESAIQFYAPASRPIIERAVQNAISQGTPYDVELEIITAQGHPRWVHAVGRADLPERRVFGFFQDITERKQVEDALRTSEQEFRTLTEAMPQMFWASRPDGWSTYFNQQWANYTGLTLEESYGNGWTKPFHPDDRQRAWEAWQRATGNDDPYALECRLRRFDGVYRWWLIRGVPLRDASGKTLKWFGTCTDIESIKNTEAALLQAKEIAEAASKAKDHFLAVLSHELRNPLNPVLTTAIMLQKNTRLDADTHEQLEIIRRNVELEARLIDDLLDVTRIERGKVELDRQPIELCTVLRWAVEVCQADIETHKFEFGIDLGPAPYWVNADAARLQQVFWNLLKNAIKFTPDGGCVGIRCRPEGEHWVCVEVNDSGAGIESEAMGRIFNAFEQAERSLTRQFGGLGLGLTISKALVEMHGGSIEVDSAGRGRGATFRIRLPRIAADTTPTTTLQPHAAAPAESPSTARPLRILLVEDHVDTVRIMSRLLAAEGHHVQAAGDVATGLNLARQHPFDLLLSDLGLPDGSGLDLMRALRSAGINLPGIAISGYGQEQDIAQSLAAGFTAHLTKPVNLQKLASLIQSVRVKQT